MSDATVRPIRVDDAAAFHACLDAVARERRWLAQVEAPPLARVAAFVADNVAAGASQFVAIVDGELVGWCDALPHWASALRHVGTLGMGVRADHRGRGLGERLLRATVDHAAAHGLCRIDLEARIDNRRAIALYEKVGFRHEGVAHAALRFDGVLHDALRMALLLGDAASHRVPSAARPGTRLVRPQPAHLRGYAHALERGWSPDTTRPQAGAEELAVLRDDAQGLLDRMDDREARGGPVTLPDGSQVARLPGLRRWIWRADAADDAVDGFCGSIGLRWQPGTTALPPHALGHIGYAVVPWRRQEGHATAALRALLPLAREATGLPWLTLTTNADNVASHRVIERAGGRFVERFTKPASFGGAEAWRWRIDLDPAG